MKLLIVLLGAALTFPPQQKIEDMIRIACIVPPSPGVKMKLQGIGPFKDGTKLQLLVVPLTEQLESGRIQASAGRTLSSLKRFITVEKKRFTYEHSGNGPGMYRIVICTEGLPKKRLAIISVVAWDDKLLDNLGNDLNRGERLIRQTANMIEQCEKIAANELTWKRSGQQIVTKLWELHRIASLYYKDTAFKAAADRLSDILSEIHDDSIVFKWEEGKLVPGNYYGDRLNFLNDSKPWDFEAFKVATERAMVTLGHEAALWILKDFTRRKDLGKLSSGGELALFYSHVKKHEKHPVVGRFMKRLLKLHAMKPAEHERLEKDLREVPQ